MYSEKQLTEKLDQYRQMPSEIEWLEFKEAKNDFHFNDLGKYFSAISNEANLKGQQFGWLIFGIQDKPPRKIVGTRYRNTAGIIHLKHEISQRTNGLTFQEIYELDLPLGRVVMFQIPAAPAGIPTSWEGHYYGRDGESLGPLSIQEIEFIRHQGALDWSAEVCSGATISDLDEEALKIAKAKFQNKHKGSRELNSAGWDDPTFLDKIKLTKAGKITKAAILLLGKPESSHYLNPHPAQISWKRDTEEQAYAHFGPPFLLSVEEVFKHIRNIKFRFQPANQLIPIELSKYEPTIILEAVNNCIAHQDYSQCARIIITEKIDRLILQNIGGFYDGTVDEYVLEDRTPEKYRNPLLVQAMVNLDMIDTMGMGIKRMFQEQRKRFFPLPEYELVDTNHVRLIIYGRLINENYSRILIENQDLPLAVVIALDNVQKKRFVSKEDAELLKKKKLVEGRYPNLFVAASIAQISGDQAKYIKNRAFDSDYYEQMILKFITTYDRATRKDIEDLIKDKLPEILTEKQKKRKIGNLIVKMKKNGLIENRGTNKDPQWMLKSI